MSAYQFACLLGSLFVSVGGALGGTTETYEQRALTFEWHGAGQQPFTAHIAGRRVAFGTCGAVSEVTSDLNRAPSSWLRFAGTLTNVQPQAVGPQAGTANYFLGPNPEQWLTDVPLFRKIKYANLYRGIDLVYYGNPGGLEYDLVVAPRASWRSIRLSFPGAAAIKIDSQGDMRLQTGSGWITYGRPRVYQPGANGRQPVWGRYVLNGAEVQFQIGDHDPRLPLIIDPALAFSSYLGGGGDDYGHAVAIDSSGCAYVVGETGSTDFPTLNPEQASMAGASDAFVTKWNATGTGLVYSTYIGGSNRDVALGVAVDTAGNVYVTGFTYSADFPITSGALRSSFMGESKAFVLKLNPSGNGLVYSTFLGGSGDDYAAGIAVDAAGEAHIAGYTDSVDFPVTAGAFQTSYGGDPYDAFLAKLNTAGSALIYATYLGGLANDTAAGVALDPGGNIYVTGQTQSSNFPTLNPVQPGSSESDAFVVKMNAAGQVMYSTYLGGTGLNNGTGIAVDAAGNAYITGFTNAPDFPVTSGAYQTGNNGSYDAFVAVLNNYGSSILSATYLGGFGSDVSYGVALDGSDNIYIVGSTNSNNFPVAAAIQSGYQGGGDAFAAAFNNQLTSLLYATYFGGAGGDVAAGVAVDRTGDVYFTGWTSSGETSPGIPVTPAAFQPIGFGGLDAFLAKLTVNTTPLACATSTPQVLTVQAGSAAQLVGDFLMTCTGGTPGMQGMATLQIALNTSMAGGQAELYVGSGSSPIYGATEGNGSALFQGILFAAPGPSASITLRITNVWANLTTVSAGAQIVMTANVVYGSPTLTVTPAQQTVAVAQNTLPVQLQQLVLSKASAPADCLPPPAADSFWTSDSAAVAWFQLGNVTVGGVARVDWSAPWGRIYQSDTLTATNSGTQCFSDSMNIAGAPLPMAGAWDANIYWNNAQLSTAPFEISKATTFDTGGKAEYAVWQPSNGMWYLAPTGDSGPTTSQQWGLFGDVPVPADYDGDGIIDFAVWRPSNGTWYIIPSSNPAKPITTQWGLYGDVPVPGDYDGDGKADVAVWRPSNGTWWIIPSSSPSNPIVTEWGMVGDIPVPADYDGDGKTDTAVWRPSNGTWYIVPSGNPTKPITTPWGALGDIPVMADYDGDGKADLAVWYPPTGTWSIIPSATPSQTIVRQWGWLGDIPVPKDYDGDGKADISVWRPSTGVFWVIPSSNPSLTWMQQLGVWGDVPVYLPEGSLTQTYHP